MLCWFLPYISFNPRCVYTSPCFEPPSYLPHNPPLLGYHRAPDLRSMDHTGISVSHWLSFYIWQCTYFNAVLSVCLTLSLPHCVHKSFLYMCLHFSSANSYQYHLSRLHIDALIYDICFFLILFYF